MKTPKKTPGKTVKILVFDPKPDITAYELAKYCLPIYAGRMPMNPETWKGLGPCQRHFVHKDVPVSLIKKNGAPTSDAPSSQPAGTKTPQLPRR